MLYIIAIMIRLKIFYPSVYNKLCFLSFFTSISFSLLRCTAKLESLMDGVPVPSIPKRRGFFSFHCNPGLYTGGNDKEGKNLNPYVRLVDRNSQYSQDKVKDASMYHSQIKYATKCTTRNNSTNLFDV